MANITEVARRAGVSRSTVSHAISGKRPISAAVKQRIYDVMAELDYHPNRLASALKTKQTRMIALLYPAERKRLAQQQLEFVSSAVEAASEHEYALTLWTSPIGEYELTRFLEMGFFDGAVVMEVKVHDHRIPFLQRYHFPFSLIGHCDDNTGLSYVDLDFEQAMMIIVEHLHTLGHTHILFLNESETRLNLEYGPAIRAQLGFVKAIQHFNVQGVMLPCEPDSKASYTLMRHLVQDNPQLSAVITINPWVVGGVTQALYDSGLRIPDDFSQCAIIASHFAEMMSPPLTGVDMPIHEMGKMGVELLLHQLENQATEPIQRLLQPIPTIRKSTGPHK